MKTLFTPGRLDDGPPEAAQHPTFREAFLFWLKLGFMDQRGALSACAQLLHALAGA